MDRIPVDVYNNQHCPSEDVEQIHLMRWCQSMETKFPCLEVIYHIPNEGRRSKSQGGKEKSMGLRAGMPDICLPAMSGRKKYCGLYIELKSLKGRPTAEQMEMLEKLHRYGNCVAVCYGAQQAEEVIAAYCNEDTDTLNRLTLSNEDFDSYRTKRAERRKKTSPLFNCFTFCIMQVLITAADILCNSSITGRSFILLLPIMAILTVRAVKESVYVR